MQTELTNTISPLETIMLIMAVSVEFQKENEEDFLNQVD